MTDLDLALEAFGLTDLIVRSNGHARPKGEKLSNAERQRRWRERKKEKQNAQA